MDERTHKKSEPPKPPNKIQLQTDLQGGTGLWSASLSIEKPPKPPWQRFMDLNLNAMKWLAPWIASNLAWEIGKLTLGFRRQHQT